MLRAKLVEVLLHALVRLVCVTDAMVLLVTDWYRNVYLYLQQLIMITSYGGTIAPSSVWYTQSMQTSASHVCDVMIEPARGLVRHLCIGQSTCYRLEYHQSVSICA